MIYTGIVTATFFIVPYYLLQFLLKKFNYVKIKKDWRGDWPLLLSIYIALPITYAGLGGILDLFKSSTTGFLPQFILIIIVVGLDVLFYKAFQNDYQRKNNLDWLI